MESAGNGVAQRAAPVSTGLHVVEVVGRGWDWLKAFGFVLWPVRFIVIVMLAMIAILSLSQGKDALYGAVVEGDRRWWFNIVVIWWAAQSWYWARFLFDHVPPRKPVLHYADPARVAEWSTRRRRRTPRALGALVFIIVGFFVWESSCGSACAEEGWAPVLWALWYALVNAGVFLSLTLVRRRAIDKVQAARAQTGASPSNQVSRSVDKLIAIAVCAWLVLLVVGLGSAFWELPPILRQSIAVAIVVVIGVVSLLLALRLPLPPSTRVVLFNLALINAALFVISIFSPAPAGQSFGPAIVLMLTAGIWVGGTSFFLAYPGEMLRVPIATLLVGAALVFGFIPKFVPPLFGYSAGDFDNHRVRTAEGALPLVTSAQGGGAANTAGLAAAFEAWKNRAPTLPCGHDHCLKPMILVSAEGGASRSGYWVASVLGALEEAFGERGFHRSVFAISSVSGGSLGAAVYQRLVARKQHGADDAQQPLCFDAARGNSNSVAVCGARILETDFLGAGFFSMFNADLLQRLVPGDIMPDRAQALETAWERTWENNTNSKDFEQPLKIRDAANLTAAGENDWLPILLLNGTSVKTGRRIMTSDVRLDPACQSNDAVSNTVPDLPSTVDFFCLTRHQIRLSTAVHNSARFPYISPAGTLWAEGDAGNQWKADRIVDGGYVEAQGATTLVDLLTTLSVKDPGWRDGLLPILITIQNDRPTQRPKCGDKTRDAVCEGDRLAQSLGEEARPMTWDMRIANDLLAPPIGLANGRSGRGEYAARALEVAVYADAHRAPARQQPEPDPGTVIKPAPAVVEWSMGRFNLLAAPGPQPAMSWYLSERSRSAMTRDLCLRDKQGNANLDAIKQLGVNFNIEDLDAAVMQGEGCSEAGAAAGRPAK